jgi:hypothetical protein
MGPAGPNTIAWRWLTLILEAGDLRQAWPLTAPDLRSTLARAWVEANQDHPGLVGRGSDELTQALAAVIPTDPLWPAFDETQLREFQEVWSWVDMSTYGAASDPRPAGPNEEGVAFVDTTAPGLVERPDGTLEVAGECDEPVPLPGKTLLMRYYEEPPDAGVAVKIGDVENGWRVAALRYNETADG